MIKVFLVEDEIVIRESIREMVPWNEYGFEFAGEASDGEMALPLVRDIKPDLLITDIKMPFMDGLTFCRLVKKELPDTKIIIISGHDDFSYAQQAIALGVEQYILKPINKAWLIEVLNCVREKYDKDIANKDYYEKFKHEIQEYEKNTRRDFFENLVSNIKNDNNIYEWAEQLGIDILAQSYNIVLFSVNTKSDNTMSNDMYSQSIADTQNEIELFIEQSKDYLLFRNQMFSYAIVVKSDLNMIEENTNNCVSKLKNIFTGKDEIDWFISIGKPVERLSLLKESYNAAMKTFALRYIEDEHIIEYHEENEKNEINLKDIDMSVINNDMLNNFLSNALLEEIDDFVDNYLKLVGEEALKSQIFRQYILLFFHFGTIDFIRKLGFDKENLEDELAIINSKHSHSTQDLIKCIKDILNKGITLRDESSNTRYNSILNKALKYIDSNYMDESLSLNKVACVANVSANHFSALFSRKMKKTFIEYLTGIRMKKAKELLRMSDKRSGEIASEVGYKDPHYFSYLFKKTQGCTPSEYRNRKEKKSDEQ